MRWNTSKPWCSTILCLTGWAICWQATLQILASHLDCIAVDVQAQLSFAGLAVDHKQSHVSLLTEMLYAEGGPGQGLKGCAEAVAAENAGIVDMSPLSLQGGAKGVGMQTHRSTADRMAQALRYG